MLRVGAASKIINNELGRPVQGATVDKVAETIRDDCEANAMFITDGSESALLVSCDLGGLTADFVRPAREAAGAAAGMDPRRVIIGGTHMHSGPSVIATNPCKPLDTEYLDHLQGWLTELASDAVGAARPSRIGWGKGSVRIGYNRRCCWAGGSHTMHGDTRRKDFTGLEGPDDPSHLALFAVDEDDAPVVVLYNNATHPTCFYGADFYSADFPGAARGYLREALGDIPVLYLNGAFGDLAIDNQLTKHHWREPRERKMLRAAHLVAGETLRLMHEAPLSEDPRLAHAFEDLAVDVRLPSAQRVAWAEDILKRVEAGQDTTAWDRVFAFGVKLLHDEFGDNPRDELPIHALRIGDVGLVSQPCELFCQFGLDIKRRSPAPMTGVTYADGAEGYCPTAYGPLGGGYSGEAIHWTRFSPDTGYRIVDTAVQLLHRLWP